MTASASGYNSGSKQCTLASGASEQWCSFGLTAATPPAPTTGTLKGISRTWPTVILPPISTVSTNGGSTTTSSSGAFSFTLPGGSYTITGTASGYNPGTKSCSVTNGSSTTCNFSLSKAPTTGTFQGVVYKNGNTSDTVFPANVSVYGLGSTVYQGSSPWTFTVPPGTYTVTATATGYLAGSAFCSVALGETKTCNIQVTAEEVPPETDAGTTPYVPPVVNDAGSIGVTDAGGSASEPEDPFIQDAGSGLGQSDLNGQMLTLESGCSGAGMGLLSGYFCIALLPALRRRRRK